MALVCIDFNLTISKENMHNIVASSKWGSYSPYDASTLTQEDKRKHEDEQWEIAKNILPAGNPKEWKESIERLIDEGHHVAITDYTMYPHLIKRYLLEVIGVDPKKMAQIIIAGSFPRHTNGQYMTPEEWTTQGIGKSQHIELALGLFKLPAKTTQVILIDDDVSNINAAKKAGYIPVQAIQGADENSKLIAKVMPALHVKLPDKVDIAPTLESPNKVNKPDKVDPTHVCSNGKLFEDHEIAIIKQKMQPLIDKGHLRQKYIRPNGDKYNVVQLEDPDSKQKKYFALYYGKKAALEQGKNYSYALGQGGYGKVKLMQDLDSGKWYAFKLQLKSNASESEADILAAVGKSAGHIVHNKISGGQFDLIGMELLSGKDMHHALISNRSILTADKWMQIGTDTLKAIQDLHNHKYLHCDIKPENFMYTADGKVIPIDLGLAQLTDSPNKSIKGTPAFMAPETNNHGIQNVKTEVYQLGKTLAQLFQVYESKNSWNEYFRMNYEGFVLVNKEHPKVRNNPCFLNVDPATRDKFINLLHRMTESDPNKRPTLSQAISEMEILTKDITAEMVHSDKNEHASEDDFDAENEHIGDAEYDDESEDEDDEFAAPPPMYDEVMKDIPREENPVEKTTVANKHASGEDDAENEHIMDTGYDDESEDEDEDEDDDFAAPPPMYDEHMKNIPRVEIISMDKDTASGNNPVQAEPESSTSKIFRELLQGKPASNLTQQPNKPVVQNDAAVEPQFQSSDAAKLEDSSSTPSNSEKPKFGR